MQIVIGPVLTREGGYAFDAWSLEDGLRRGHNYRRIEDAHYARNSEIRCRGEGRRDDMVACNTLDEFVRSTMGVSPVRFDHLAVAAHSYQRVQGSSPYAPTSKTIAYRV